jgi:hypothetical protein
MKKIVLGFAILIGGAFVLTAPADVFAKDGDKKNIRYKKGKRIDFESLLVEGENKKPEMSVVTGNIGKKDLGLLKLRKDFNDFMANDAGEKIQ